MFYRLIIFATLVCFSGFASASATTDFKISVQCHADGPVYEGVLTLANQINGKCTSGGGIPENKYWIIDSPTYIALTFNSLSYNATVTNYNFRAKPCVWKNFTYIDSSNSSYPPQAVESSSGLEADFSLVSYGTGFSGKIGNCSYRTK